MHRIYTVSKDTQVNKKSISDAIKKNEEWLTRYKRLRRYYDGKHDILDRQKEGALKNNKIVVNHPEYITDLYVGYLHGIPVDYRMEGEGNDDVLSPVTEEYKKQDIASTDSELGEDNSIYGTAYEYVYANEENEVVSAKIPVENCIVVYDDTMDHNKLFAVIYDECKNGDEYVNVRVITPTDIQTWDSKLNAITATEIHTFKKVPVIQWTNNSKLKGDFESVLNIVDAYNIIQSDRVNDKEQLVEAILVLYGFEITTKQAAKVRQTRIMSAPPKTEGTQAEYLIKEMNETEVDVLRSRLEADIHKISKTPNMSDKDFAQNDSGVAIKFKLLPFEWSTKKKERFVEKALRARFELYNTYLNTLSSSNKLVEAYKVEVVFTRSLPLNDLETAQMISYLKGTIDDETLIKQLSFVKDASKIIDKMKKEKEEMAKLYAPQYGTAQPNNDNTPQDNTNV